MRSISTLLGRMPLMQPAVATSAALWPVLTGYDGHMAVPGPGRFLDDEFHTLLGSLPAPVVANAAIREVVFGIRGPLARA